MFHTLNEIFKKKERIQLYDLKSFIFAIWRNFIQFSESFDDFGIESSAIIVLLGKLVHQS